VHRYREAVELIVRLAGLPTDPTDGPGPLHKGGNVDMVRMPRYDPVETVGSSVSSRRRGEETLGFGAS